MLGVPVLAGRVGYAVVAGGASPCGCPAVAVVDAAGGGVSNADADADARSRVAESVCVPASVGVTASVGLTASVGVTPLVAVTASVAVTIGTAVTNAPAPTRTEAAAEAWDATPSSWPDAASENAATGSVATKRRGVHGGMHGGQPVVVVAADGVGTRAEAAGDRGGIMAGERRNGGAPTGRRAAQPDAGRRR